IYHSRPTAENGQPYRMHLRLEKNGGGLLILNASTVLHLNQTAAEYAYHLVQDTPEQEVVKTMTRRYRASAEEVRLDYRTLVERIQALTNLTDLDPVTFLDMEREDLYSGEPSAPLRLDCALTYKTGDESSDASPLQRARRELTCEEWKTILDQAWAFGIPHVIFTGGEPTLRPDLVDLVRHAQELGQVTGLLTSGARLTEKDYLHHLLDAGLDHILLTLDPASPPAWEALRDALVEDIFVAVHLTINRQNYLQVAEIISRLAEMKVPAISLSTGDPVLKPDVQLARQLAADRGMRLIWDLPVPYSQTNPVSIEIAEGETIPQGAGKAWLYVEPDGDILPGQGILHVLGNLTEDTWEKLWPVSW
ncbi:MAG TPA: radical SAM protein, partial [Anaerolineaceae bacterium]|nr:radical SAM protein [Anaerolineaceae bacterium]